MVFPLIITSVHFQVPAYFDEEQREATIQAGRLAGLDTVKLIRYIPSTEFINAAWF